MKKSNWLLLTTILVITSAILFFAFSCKTEADSMETDITAINELYDQYCLAANTGDLDLFISLWADDATRMDPDLPAIVGKENIRAHFKVPFEQFNTNVAIYGETEVHVSGDLAFSRGTYTLSLTPKEGGPTTYIDGKWLDILKRQADGSWKIYIDCVNYNAPPKVGIENRVLRLTFDGESCSYEGPTVLKAGPITLIFFNESKGTAAVNLVVHTGDETIQDAIDYIGEEPTTKHHPYWTRELGTWKGVLPGERLTWEGDLEPGIYHMVCARFTPFGVWFGTGLTVED